MTINTLTKYVARRLMFNSTFDRADIREAVAEVCEDFELSEEIYTLLYKNVLNSEYVIKNYDGTYSIIDELVSRRVVEKNWHRIISARKQKV